MNPTRLHPNHSRATGFRAVALALSSLVLTSTGGLAASAPARSAAAPVDMSLSPFLTLFPELKTAAAPTRWLKTGNRWTYYYQYAGVFDPDVDTPTSGNGYFQFDLVALNANRSAVSFKTYLDNGMGYLIPTPAVSSIQLPGLGEFWLAPSVLVRAEGVANPNLTVKRMPKTIGSRTYQCVRFQSTRDDNSAEYVWMFEVTTGKLIYYRHRIGELTDPEHQSAQIWLVHERALPLPWKSAQIRPWVASGTPWTARYAGTQKIEFSNDPSPIFLYYVTDLVRTRYQQQWCEYLVTDYLYTDQTGWVQQGSVASVTGVAQLFDAIWLPPEAIPIASAWPLNRFVKLDTDPITKAVVFGKRIANNGIVMREKGLATAVGPVFQTDMSYRQSDGKLTKIVRTDVTDLLTKFMIKTISLDLQ